MRLSDFKVLTFDCYGTLIDWKTGQTTALRPLLERAAAAGRPISADDAFAARARHEHAQQVQTPGMRYADLLAVVFKRLAEELGVAASHEECVAFGRSVGDWPAFPDTAEALRYLKGHYRLAVLSNVDNASFERTKRHLGVELDHVVTAEDAGSYKPALRNFHYLFERLGPAAGRTDILHTAQSLFHDHAPANALRLASCWINRYGGRAGDAPRFDFEFPTLGAMVEAHRAEVGG